MEILAFLLNLVIFNNNNNKKKRTGDQSMLGASSKFHILKETSPIRTLVMQWRVEGWGVGRTRELRKKRGRSSH